MTGPCNCRHCTTPAAVEPPAAPQPIELPDQPTPIRVHTAGLPPQDCTLHPDGTLTAVIGGELRRNWLTLADMRKRNWALARIEFNPGPLPAHHESEPKPEVVQEAIAL